MDRLLTYILAFAFLFCCCVDRTGVEGSWGKWSKITPCSTTCGRGVQARVRKWIPADGEPKLEVPFTNTEQFDCMIKECPVNGSWSVWGIWGECSAACGGGVRKRHRDCDSPPPMYGGADCEGHKYDEDRCSLGPCPPTPPGFDLTKCKKETTFMCKNKLMCVPLRQHCDDVLQCSDGSDEVGCRRRGYKIGRVHFSNASSSRHSASITVAAIAVLTSSWYSRLLVGRQ